MSFLQHIEKIKSNPASREDMELTEELKRMVMATCNVRVILESWGVRPVLVHGNQWKGYCPDHVLHDGHPQHQPKWFMNAENGDCICFTSSKPSNFIYVAKRLYRLGSIEETIRALTNGESLVLPPPEFVVDEKTSNARSELEAKLENDRKRGVEMMKKLLARGEISDRCLEYFANDGIEKDTLDFLGVCSVESGWLEGRAMIPFLDSAHEICGYVAVCYMGAEWWCHRQYDRMRKIDPDVTMDSVKKEYRKTLYCPGFKSRNHLYGQYEVLNGGNGLERLMVVEGERDAMKMLQEGIDCVSIHGTSLKPEQKTMLKRMNPSELYMGLDMDKAGCIAALKAYDQLFSEMERVYMVNFPDGKDPKKFSGQEMNEMLAYAGSHFDENYSERERIAGEKA